MVKISSLENLNTENLADEKPSGDGAPSELFQSPDRHVELVGLHDNLLYFKLDGDMVFLPSVAKRLGDFRAQHPEMIFTEENPYPDEFLRAMVKAFYTRYLSGMIRINLIERNILVRWSAYSTHSTCGEADQFLKETEPEWPVDQYYKAEVSMVFSDGVKFTTQVLFTSLRTEGTLPESINTRSILTQAMNNAIAYPGENYTITLDRKIALAAQLRDQWTGLLDTIQKPEEAWYLPETTH